MDGRILPSYEEAEVEDQSNQNHTAWDELVRAASERAHTRQALMIERYGLSGDVQYFWSMDDARITWSRDEQVFLTGRLTMIGSVSVPYQSWLWSWANDSIPRPVLGDIEQVRRYGEANSFPALTNPGFHSHPEDVAEARMVAASVLDAEGLWTDSDDEQQLHFLVHDLTLV